MTEVARYTLHVSSSQRVSGSLTDFNIQLSQVISRLAKGSRFSVIVHGITVPFSFYQLSSDIATLNVSWTGGETGSGTITMTPGNYTSNSVLLELSSRLTALLLTDAVALTTDFMYDVSTGRMILRQTSIPAVEITLNFTANSLLGRFFGFSASAVLPSSTTYISSQVSDKMAVANPVTYLLLRCPTLKQFGNREWIVNRDDYSDIIYRVPITTNVGTYIQYYGDQEPFTIINDTISAVNFYLTTNLTYNPIDLQGLPFAFHMTISERLQPDYEPIMTTALPKMITEIPQNTSELEALKKERDDALRRLETYKKKLTPKEKDALLLQRQGEANSNL
jgi:hypothetical protein